MLAWEIIFAPLIVIGLWRTLTQFREASRLVERMPLPPYDHEVETVWAEIAEFASWRSG